MSTPKPYKTRKRSKASPKASPKASQRRTTHSQQTTQKKKSFYHMLHTAWTSFLHYVKHAFTLTGQAFKKAIVYAIQTLYSAFVKIFKVVFYPLLLITRSIQYVSKSIAKVFITQWKRIISVLFIIVATSMTMDENKLASIIHGPSGDDGVDEEQLPNRSSSTPSPPSPSPLPSSKTPPTLVQGMRNKLKLLQSALMKYLYQPLLTFVSIGLPQLAYEILRIWHFVLADGATSFIDMFVSSLRFAKSILPTSFQSCLQWDLLSSPSFSSRLAQNRKTQRSTDPLLGAYVSALQSINTKSKQATHAIKTLKFNQQTHHTLKQVWMDIVQDVSKTKNSAISKYIQGNMKPNENTNVSQITLKQATRQLGAEPMSLMRTVKQNSWFNMFNTKQSSLHPSSAFSRLSKNKQKTIKDVYQKGSKTISKYIFGQDDPEKITIQNVLHVYFGIVALNGASSGAIEGFRNVYFDHTKTLTSSKIANSMHVTEEVVPESFFYLDD